MSRPHLSKSIDQLEDLFATSMSGEAVLEQLAEELSFRRTPRAKELLNEVRNALSLIQRERGHTPQETAPQRQEPRGRTPSAVSAAPPAHSDLTAPVASGLDQVPLSHPVAHTNQATDILDAWSALEVLSPTTFKRRAELASNVAQNIVPIGPGLPWDGGSARSRPNFKVYFHIILGTLSAESAFGKLRARFQDARVNPPNIKGDVVLASLLVDKDAGRGNVGIALGFRLGAACRASRILAVTG